MPHADPTLELFLPRRAKTVWRNAMSSANVTLDNITDVVIAAMSPDI
jgi:hypothetical protein